MCARVCVVRVCVHRQQVLLHWKRPVQLREAALHLVWAENAQPPRQKGQRGGRLLHHGRVWAGCKPRGGNRLVSPALTLWRPPFAPCSSPFYFFIFFACSWLNRLNRWSISCFDHVMVVGLQVKAFTGLTGGFSWLRGVSKHVTIRAWMHVFCWRLCAGSSCGITCLS